MTHPSSTPLRSPVRQLMTALMAMLLIAAPLAAARDTLPEGYPETFSWTGTVDRIDIDNRRIVIRDALFLLDKEVVVHARHARRIPLSALRPGTKVGIRLAPSGERGERAISEIWIFPRGQRLMLPPPKP